MSGKRILAILDTNPFPATDGKTYPIAGHLRGLAANWEIDILEVHRPLGKNSFESETHHEYASQVFRVQAPARRKVARRLCDEILKGHPYFLEPAASSEDLKAILGDQEYDAIYVSPLGMANWATAVADSLPQRPKLVLNLNDSITDRFRRDFDLFRMRVLSAKTSCKHFLQSLRVTYMAKIEKRILSQFDLVLVQTGKDRDAIVKDCGSGFQDRLEVAPNGIKESLLKLPYQQASAKRLVHVGALTRNRGELVFWFLKNVFGPVRESVPDVTIELAGNVTDADRKRLEQMPGVIVSGFVDRVDDVLANATMSIAPLFMRSGLVNKMLDSMAAGVPCSGAKVFNGFEGFVNGRHGFDVGSAKEWVDVLVDVLQDPERLQEISQAGRDLVCKNLRWSKTIDTVDRRMRDLVSGVPRKSHPLNPPSDPHRVKEPV